MSSRRMKQLHSSAEKLWNVDGRCIAGYQQQNFAKNDELRAVFGHPGLKRRYKICVAC